VWEFLVVTRADDPRGRPAGGHPRNPDADRHLAAGAILLFGGLGVLVADVVTAAVI
jgi:hypothetical protein